MKRILLASFVVAVLVIVSTALAVGTHAPPNDPQAAQDEAPGTSQQAEGVSDARAEELVATWIDAVGGLEAYRPLRTARTR